jgi:hypothetical protein
MLDGIVDGIVNTASVKISRLCGGARSDPRRTGM